MFGLKNEKLILLIHVGVLFIYKQTDRRTDRQTDRSFAVHVGKSYRQEFDAKVGVHQGSVLSPLLFIIVLEAFSHEFCSGVIIGR